MLATRQLIRWNFLILFITTHGYPLYGQDSEPFGQNERLSNALRGEIYFLPEGTYQLPDFDTLKPAGTIYSRSIDVSPRDWQSGFPGLPDRFEWFAVVYKASFSVKQAGLYKFNLLSDDGSKLFIDDSLVINNDGAHAPHAVAGEIELDESEHSIEVQYFQGPRAGIALQLSVSLNGANLEIFPTKDIELTTPGLARSWLWLLVPLAALLGYLLRKKTKENSNVKVMITNPRDRSMFPCGDSITLLAQTMPPGREHEISWEVPMEQQQSVHSGSGGTFSVSWNATGVKQVIARIDQSADDVLLFLYKTPTGKLTVRDILQCDPPVIQRDASAYHHYRKHSIPEDTSTIKV